MKNKGMRKNPGMTADEFGFWERKAKHMTISALEYSIQDCRQAIRAGINPDKYYDQISVFQNELVYRARHPRKNPEFSHGRYDDPDNEMVDLESAMQEGYVISDMSSMSQYYRVASGVKEIAQRVTFQGAVELIAKDMERQQFWPDVFYVNDHGNVDVIAIRVGKRRITYKIVASYV